jgi:hypothetical protein
MENKDKYLQMRKEKRKQLKLKKKIQKKAKPTDPLKVGKSRKTIKSEANKKLSDSPILIIDSSFESKMEDKWLKSLMNQYQHINALLKNNEKILRVEITGLEDQCLEILKNKQADKWLLKLFKENYLEKFQNKITKDVYGNEVEPYQQQTALEFDIKNLIYLSGDAEEEMESFDDK